MRASEKLAHTIPMHRGNLLRLLRAKCLTGVKFGDPYPREGVSRNGRDDSVAFGFSKKKTVCLAALLSEESVGGVSQCALI